MGKTIRATCDHLVKLVVCLVAMNISHRQVHGDVTADPNYVSMTYLANAVEKGAVCNDGTPATYYYSPGFGEGVNSWHVYLDGGAWCNDDASCRDRQNYWLGSSKFDPPTKYFKQIRTMNQTENPDFYNWNKVFVMYCDSASFMGITDHPNVASRGARIFDAVMGELLQKGMANANNAILYGSSAGGLAAMLHCDGFRTLFPNNIRVKCISDSGFFIHAPKLHGADKRAEYFASVVAYHGFANKLSPSCTSTMNASLCIFPEYMAKYIQTPLFIVESKFDEYQLSQHVSDDLSYTVCMKNILQCTPSDLQSIRDFGVAFTEILQEVRQHSSSISMFVQPCRRHVHFIQSSGWNRSYKLKNKTIQQAIGDWFYDRDSLFQEIDADHELPLVPIPPNSQTFLPIPIQNA